MFFFFFQAEDGIRDGTVTGVQTCALPICFVAERDTWLGTIPIGYGDGYRRDLTNNAEVVVAGRRVPVVGAVSMDNITVDLGPEAPEQPGVRVALIGDGVRAEELAERLGTI